MNATNRIAPRQVGQASWEGFVIVQLIASAGPQWQPLNFRTASGTEVDLVLEHSGGVDTFQDIMPMHTVVARCAARRLTPR